MKPAAIAQPPQKPKQGATTVLAQVFAALGAKQEPKAFRLAEWILRKPGSLDSAMNMQPIHSFSEVLLMSKLNGNHEQHGVREIASTASHDE